MKTKCKQPPGTAVQLQVHQGSITEAEDVEVLVWLRPSLQGDILHCASLHKCTKSVCWICAPQAFTRYFNIKGVSIIVPVQLDLLLFFSQ